MNSTEYPALRVLHLNSKLSGGGTDDQCVKLAQQLTLLGQKVFIAGPAAREWSSRIGSAGLPLLDTKQEGLFQLAFIMRAARFIRQERIQIVHGHHGRDIWPTILAARLSGVTPKVVLTRHLAKSPSSFFSRAFVLGQCDAMIAVSETVAKILRTGAYEPDAVERERRARPPMQGDHTKIQVIYGGIDTNLFRPAEAETQRAAWGLAPENFAFVVAGGYDLPRGKGQQEFLQAAAKIHQKIPQARFLIVGRGNMKDILETDIAQLGLHGKASLTSYCQDMPAAMNALDCLVHPQIGTEALGLVLCEAHACGKPVIASDLDGIPEAFTAGNYGQLVKAESKDQLADAMARWAQHPRLSWPERWALHDRVEARFSLPVSARNVLRLYRSLIGEVID